MSTMCIRGGTLSIMLGYASNVCALCIKVDYARRTFQLNDFGPFEFGTCWVIGLLILGHG